MLFGQVRNLFLICFICPLFREYSGCHSVLFSCYFCSLCFHRSVLSFSVRSAGRVSFSWFSSTPRCSSRFPFLCLFSPRQFLCLGSVAITGPDSCFGFHFAVSRFGREARRLTKDLQSSICRSVEIRSKSFGPCAASGFRLGAATSLCVRIGFPVPGSRSAQAPWLCLLPISVFCVRSRQELAIVFLLRWPDSRSSVICSTAKFCPLMFSL
jgi:hypothetical protein